MSEEIRVRFAPSPTGYLHVGGARTALYNFIFARQQKGKFILRVEDTDQARSTEEALKMQIEDLTWLGLKWDEGVDPVTLKDIGPHGPYRQSQRLPIYKKHAEELIQKGLAYYCFMTDAEIEAQKAQSQAEGSHAHLESPYQDMPLETALAKLAAGEKAVVRFKTKHLKKDYVFQDLVRGEIKFPSDMVGDFVLLRSDGMPVYNFCCVVDDGLMKISHVLRAEEHLPNTLRQLMIYEGLGWSAPEFGHISLVLGEDRQKLSKRHGATSCNEYKNQGYMPQALKNFVALCGWSSPEGKEIMSEEEMISQFGVDRLNPAGAIFDAVKFKWMNSVYLRALPDLEIWKGCEPFFKREAFEFPQNTEWQQKAIQVFKVKMETFQDAIELFRPLSQTSFVIHEEESKEALAWESSPVVLNAWKQMIEAHPSDFLTEAEFEQIQDAIKNQTGTKGKNLFMPIRVAVIGKPHGAELKILVPLMHKKMLLERANQVLAKVAK